MEKSKLFPERDNKKYLVILYIVKKFHIHLNNFKIIDKYNT